MPPPHHQASCPVGTRLAWAPVVWSLGLSLDTALSLGQGTAGPPQAFQARHWGGGLGGGPGSQTPDNNRPMCIPESLIQGPGAHFTLTTTSL